MPRPLHDRRNAIPSVHDHSLRSRERRRATIGVRKGFCAVIGGENNDRILLKTLILEPLQHDADVVVHLLHPRPSRSADSAWLHIWVRGVSARQHVAAGGVHPDEERLVVRSGLGHKVDRRLGDHLIKGGHVVFDSGPGAGRQRTLIHNFLLADLAPARLLCRVVDIRRPAVNQVARANVSDPFGRIGVVPIRNEPLGIQAIPGSDLLLN